MQPSRRRTRQALIVRLGLAIAAGLLLGVGVAVYLGEVRLDRMPSWMPGATARVTPAQQARAKQLADERTSLYRWRDARGVLQITQTPPKGRRYERITRLPDRAIEVRGERPAIEPPTD